MTAGPRALPFFTPMHRGQLPACSCRHPPVDGLHRQSGRTASRNTPSTIMSPTQAARIEDRDKAGRPRAPDPHHPPSPAPPARPAQPIHDQLGSTPRTCTDKERESALTGRAPPSAGALLHSPVCERPGIRPSDDRNGRPAGVASGRTGTTAMLMPMQVRASYGADASKSSSAGARAQLARTPPLNPRATAAPLRDPPCAPARARAPEPLSSAPGADPPAWRGRDRRAQPSVRPPARRPHSGSDGRT